MAIGAMNQKCLGNTSFSLPVDIQSFSSEHLLPTEKLVTADPLINSVCTKHVIRGGQTIHADYMIAWHFANLSLGPTIQGKGRFYNQQFKNAVDVVKYVADHFSELSSQTKLWQHTWYDSTLPWWFLERSF